MRSCEIPLTAAALAITPNTIPDKVSQAFLTIPGVTAVRVEFYTTTFLVLITTNSLDPDLLDSVLDVEVEVIDSFPKHDFDFHVLGCDPRMMIKPRGRESKEDAKCRP